MPTTFPWRRWLWGAGAVVLCVAFAHYCVQIVPADAPPRPVGAFDRVPEAVGVVNKVQLGLPARAVSYFGVGHLYFNGFAVPDVDSGGAGSGAHVADAVFNRYWLDHLRSFSSPGLTWSQGPARFHLIIAGFERLSNFPEIGPVCI